MEEGGTQPSGSREPSAAAAGNPERSRRTRRGTPSVVRKPSPGGLPSRPVVRSHCEGHARREARGAARLLLALGVPEHGRLTATAGGREVWASVGENDGFALYRYRCPD